jgi:hypothetical protein
MTGTRASNGELVIDARTFFQSRGLSFDETPSTAPAPQRQPATAPDRENRVRVADLQDVMSLAADRVPYIVDRLVPEAGITMFSGQPESGKSSILCAILGAIHSGSPFAGRSTTPRPVLLLDRENPATTVASRLRWQHIEHIGRSVFGGWSDPGHDAPDPTSVSVLEWVEACNPKPVVALDSLSSFMQGDENSTRDVHDFFVGIRRLTFAGVTFVVLHHSGKSETSKLFRGNSTIRGDVDAGFLVENLSSDPNRLSRLSMKAWKRRTPVDSPILLEFDDLACRWLDCKPDASELNGERLIRLLRTNPGISKRSLQNLAHEAGVTFGRTATWLNQGLRTGLVLSEKRGTGSIYYAGAEGGADV